ncbi:methyltransferase [Phenylobacterium aquaticum]|uniref:methyltransferase n=1 Tax=Phenylobacterium aquaticum TaxID=1763816 RepID=UPI0026F28245|nr:methyltransferase [Phenylobacterium aquaticum]
MASYLENLSDWFRARLAGPGHMATPDDAQMGLKVLAIWRSRMIADFIVRRLGSRVLAGPFEGMTYVAQSTEGALAPRLLGTYESELHPHIAALAAQGVDCVIDVGCAEGYYAVGLARLLPQAAIYAFDRDAAALKACGAMAALNDVAERVEVAGDFRPEAFQRFADRRCLVIMDVEGAEDELLRPDLAPALAGMSLIVETHDLIRPGVQARVRERFAATHDILQVDPGPKPQILPEAMRGMSHLDQLLAVWEFRAGPTPWLVMTPKGARALS